MTDVLFCVESMLKFSVIEDENAADGHRFATFAEIGDTKAPVRSP